MVNLFDSVNILVAHQRALLVQKTLARGSMGVFGRGGVGGYNWSGGSFQNWGSTPSNGPSKGTTTARPTSRIGVATGLKCFWCGEQGHRIADCRKGKKYGKGLFVDSGGAFKEQGDWKEQKVAFNEDEEAEEEFISGEAQSGPILMVRRVCFTLRKAKDEDKQCHNLFHS